MGRKEVGLLFSGWGSAGWSKSPSSKAAGEQNPQAYPLGYVEEFCEPRTSLAGFFTILLGIEVGERESRAGDGLSEVFPAADRHIGHEHHPGVPLEQRP